MTSLRIIFIIQQPRVTSLYHTTAPIIFFCFPTDATVGRPLSKTKFNPTNLDDQFGTTHFYVVLMNVILPGSIDRNMLRWAYRLRARSGRSRKSFDDSTRAFSDTSSFTSEGSSFSNRSINEKSVSYLDQLIFDNCWEEASSFVKANAGHAKKERKAPQFMNTAHDSVLLPIHLACAFSTVTLEFLEALIFANPASLKATESGNQRNCLHIAIKSGAQDTIISYLIEKYPGGLLIQDSMGRLPLHYAVSNHRSMSLISKIVSSYPNTVLAQDEFGWTSLHIAVSQCTPMSVIEFLISEGKEALTMITAKGRTPLHLACQVQNKNMDGVIKVLKKADNELCDIPEVRNYRKAESSQRSIWDAMEETSFA